MLLRNTLTQIFLSLYMRIILFIVLVVVVLFVVLRNDHDRSYDKREGRVSLPPEVPGARAVVDPRGVQKRTLTWAYLYNMQFDAGLPEGSMISEVTGMRYYCSIADIGPVNGFVRAEPTNPHDSRAQAVIRADGKMLGYIPRRALSEYEAFNPTNLPCPFSGYITVDRQGFLHADILLALPKSMTFVKKQLSRYLEEA